MMNIYNLHLEKILKRYGKAGGLDLIKKIDPISCRQGHVMLAGNTN